MITVLTKLSPVVLINQVASFSNHPYNVVAVVAAVVVVTVVNLLTSNSSEKHLIQMPSLRAIWLNCNRSFHQLKQLLTLGHSIPVNVDHPLSLTKRKSPRDKNHQRCQYYNICDNIFRKKLARFIGEVKSLLIIQKRNSFLRKTAGYVCVEH